MKREGCFKQKRKYYVEFGEVNSISIIFTIKVYLFGPLIQPILVIQWYFFDTISNKSEKERSERGAQKGDETECHSRQRGFVALEIKF